MANKIAFFLLIIFSGSIVASDRPNVLMLIVDDFNDWGGKIGRGIAKTPNLDKLASRGTTFTNAHVPAVFCSPSRTAMLTGKHPVNTGCYANNPHYYSHPHLVTLPAWFKKAGYGVYGGGKIAHHMPGWVDPNEYHQYFHWNSKTAKTKGYHLDSWSQENLALPVNSPVSAIGKKYKHLEYAILPNENEAKMADTLLVDQAIEFLTKKQDKAFFLAVGLYAPHKPNYAPQKYFDLYDKSKIFTPPLKVNDASDLPKSAARIIKSTKDVEALNEAQNLRHAYLACLSYADAQMGRVLDALENSGQKDNTIVVFWSDHGWHLGEKNKWGKHTLWDRTSRIPFVFAGPGIPKNLKYDKPTAAIDTYPTLLELCGISKNKDVDGVSLKPIFDNPKTDLDRKVLVASHHEGELAIVHNNWRLISRKDGYELYNMDKDPNEWENLANIPEYNQTLKVMISHLPKNVAPNAPETGKELRAVFNDDGSSKFMIKKNKFKKKK
ncbi:MAG: sulfatase [Lentisphaeraceae bacterium]|nr:sulfatase [Lentisphaeraceae bacterium]